MVTSLKLILTHINAVKIFEKQCLTLKKKTVLESRFSIAYTLLKKIWRQRIELIEIFFYFKIEYIIGLVLKQLFSPVKLIAVDLAE